MLTWVDVLYEEGLLGDWWVGVCPSDERPDPPTEARAFGWRFQFVDEMGVKENKKRGVRTSYALSAIMNLNNPRNNYPDAGRQIEALDGWWTWAGSLNAMWLASGRSEGGQGGPMLIPHEQGTMVGWRHTTEYICQTLFCDGHVARIVPNLVGLNLVPSEEDPDRTVDTTKAFFFLPGERTDRWPYATYQGEIEEYRGRDPTMSGGKELWDGGPIVPANYPEEDLSPNIKTIRRLWKKFPPNPRERW
jgi:prepilin-type processing-associated H-X9-DG protein